MIATAQKFLSCILLASSILTSCFIGQSALQKVGASGLYLSLQGSRIIKTSLSLWSRSLPAVAAVEELFPTSVKLCKQGSLHFKIWQVLCFLGFASAFELLTVSSIYA